MKRISIAFSPIPFLFVLGVGGGVYYYFFYKPAMHVIAVDDPLSREIARRAADRAFAVEKPPRRAPVETVSIFIDGTPPALTILWNGEVKFERPLIVPRGSDAAEVLFKSPGFEDKVVTIVPDKEQTVTVRLKKERRKKRPEP